MRLDDGSVREKEVTALRGSRARPFMPDEQAAKLHEAGKHALGPEQLQQLASDSRLVGDQGIAPVMQHLRTAA